MRKDLKEKMRTLNPQSGFTLLEVLVAFVILASSLGIIYQLTLTGGLRTRQSTDEILALLVAKNRLQEPLGPNWRYKEGQEGKFKWTVNKAPYNNDNPLNRRNLVKLWKIDVTVSWQAFTHKKSINLSTLRPEK